MKKLLFSLILGSWFCVAGAVTLNVEVPPATKHCYVCGAFNGWSATDAIEMASAGENLYSIDLAQVDDASLAGGYKYLCGQDWAYVEKSATGAEISNRTVAGSPDVVGSWASVPEWDIFRHELTLNGIPRVVRVYVPRSYAASTESYPVIYYNTLQQRFNNSGDDSDPGDDFFNANSWNATESVEALAAAGGKEYILVQINSLLAENTLEANEDFAGTGQIAPYFEAFVSELIPFIEGKYRVASGASETTIAGADYGALFSLYASLMRPDIFGNCVAMSPMLWINEGAVENLAATTSAAGPRTFYISAGSLEPAWMQQDVASLAIALRAVDGALVNETIFTGASHEDVSWGKAFAKILPVLASGAAPEANVAAPLRVMKAQELPLQERVYTLYAGEDQNDLAEIGTLEYTADYRRKESAEPCEACIITYGISASVQGNYYWNIAMGASGADGWMYDTPKKIGFSSKKTSVSWHNVAVFEDETVQNSAVSSVGFRMVTAQGSELMACGDNFTATATAKFPGDDKSVTVNSGSVNSQSDLGAISASYNASANCVEADIIYDFNLNKVTVTETAYGASLDNVKIKSFTAEPAVCEVGTPVRVTLSIAGRCDIAIHGTHSSGETMAPTVTDDGDGTYSFEIASPKEGLYTVGADFSAGENKIENAAMLHIKVLAKDEDSKEKILTVNAYEGVDWSTIGRFKANFHTHTSQSFDTKFSTTQVVDRYKEAGYSILALTDHDANSYPWTMFSLYNSDAEDRDPASMGILAIPGNELSKDLRNSWSEKTGGDFNHHNDFFTGRRGQEFMSLRESYAYTYALGGMQIINHPGQYWSLSRNYTPGEKNSPEWHAENFLLYPSLVGLEVYNQGNRRPNDRILWDQILSLTMPGRPVWGYSCDDTHTAEQYFRNYDIMLMPELSVDALEEAMRAGSLVFSCEYTGSGEAKSPAISSIAVDADACTITIDTPDADEILWLSDTHIGADGSATSRASNVVAMGPVFSYSGFRGSYVRALLRNAYGETATQPWGFSEEGKGSAPSLSLEAENPLVITVEGKMITARCGEGIERLTLLDASGAVMAVVDGGGRSEVVINARDCQVGAYVVVGATAASAYASKVVLK